MPDDQLHVPALSRRGRPGFRDPFGLITTLTLSGPLVAAHRETV